MKLTLLNTGVPIWLNWRNIVSFTPNATNGAYITVSVPIMQYGTLIQVNEDCEAIDRELLDLVDQQQNVEVARAA